jgi:oxygen-independent coproporphyrinogen-3 oxidase
MDAIQSGAAYSETEELTIEERYHDYLITSLRTRWGADPDHILQEFGESYTRHFNRKAAPYLESGIMYKNSAKVAVHPDHWLIMDHLLRELFMGH